MSDVTYITNGTLVSDTLRLRVEDTSSYHIGQVVKFMSKPVPRWRRWLPNFLRDIGLYKHFKVLFRDHAQSMLVVRKARFWEV